MPSSSLHHSNHCPRCPLIGQEDGQRSETYQFLSLRFDIKEGRKLSRPAMLHRVEPLALKQWLESTRILEAHIDHLPKDLGPGLMVTLPNGCGRLVIDGNHRAARVLRQGKEFLAYLLPERETHQLLRTSMGKRSADFYWQRLLNS